MSRIDEVIQDWSSVIDLKGKDTLSLLSGLVTNASLRRKLVEKQRKASVDHFLCWKTPKDFSYSKSLNPRKSFINGEQDCPLRLYNDTDLFLSLLTFFKNEVLSYLYEHDVFLAPL